MRLILSLLFLLFSSPVGAGETRGSPDLPLNEVWAGGGTLNQYVTAIGSATKTLVISQPISYGAVTTVPANVTLAFTGAGIIDCGGVVGAVTIQGEILVWEGEHLFTNFVNDSVRFTGNHFISEIPVGWWGAEPDGATASSAAIQAAIKAASTQATGIVSFLIGTYSIDAKLQLLYSNITLRGAGMYQTTLKLADGKNVDVLSTEPTTGQSNIVIEDLGIDGNQANQVSTKAGILLDAVSNVHIRRVYIHDIPGSGVYSFSVERSMITDSVFANNTMQIASNFGAIRHVGGSNFRFLRNKIDSVGGTSNQAISAGKYVGPPEVLARYGEISGNRIDTVSGIGIATSGSQNTTISANVISNCTGHGIDYGLATNQTIVNNTILDSNNGIGGARAADERSRTVIIGNQVIHNWPQTINSGGIQGIYGAATITGNYIEGAYTACIGINDGQDVIAAHNICKDSIGAGIFLATTGAGTKTIKNILLHGNLLIDEQGTPTQTYGIRLETGTAGSIDTVKIQDNVIQGVLTAPLAFTGAGPTPTNVTFRDNTGYLTENSGTGTITSGSTSVAVTHGLARTPAAKDIVVTLTENPTNDPGNTWVDTITSTQFTVNVRSDPGVSNLDFSWQAFIH